MESTSSQGDRNLPFLCIGLLVFGTEMMHCKTNAISDRFKGIVMVSCLGGMEHGLCPSFNEACDNSPFATLSMIKISGQHGQISFEL